MNAYHRQRTDQTDADQMACAGGGAYQVEGLPRGSAKRLRMQVDSNHFDPAWLCVGWARCLT
jgi:hypothetical protein